MKCATEGCLKEASTNLGLCLRCAPLDHISSEGKKESNSLSSMEKYSTKAPGEPSPPASEKGSRIQSQKESATKLIMPIEKNRGQGAHDGMRSTARLCGIDTKKDGDLCQSTQSAMRIESEPMHLGKIENASASSAPGIEQKERNTLQKSTPAEIVEIPREASTEQLLSSAEEQLASLSLADDVIQRLHLQMRRLTLSPDQVKGALDPISASKEEASRVGLAIKSAAEMRQFIKLKLEAYKIFRDPDYK